MAVLDGYKSRTWHTQFVLDPVLAPSLGDVGQEVTVVGFGTTNTTTKVGHEMPTCLGGAISINRLLSGMGRHSADGKHQGGVSIVLPGSGHRHLLLPLGHQGGPDLCQGKG